MLNLNEGELEWLSNHLGHSIDVHKEFYRNQETAIQLGKVAKTLLAMDKGHTLTELEHKGMFETFLMNICIVLVKINT